MTTPTYKVFVDWDSDGGLTVGDFEQTTDGWDPAATGTTAPTIARSTTRSYHGVASLLVTWSAGGSTQLVQPDPMGTFVVGRSYTVSAWVYVPSSSGQHVKWTVPTVSSGSASSTTNAWVQITHTFTATATTHSLQVVASSTPSGGEQTWIDMARIIGPGEDLTAATPGVISDIGIQYGRDQARSLQPVSPGSADFQVDNASRDYSPENSSSPLAGLLGPGRETVFEATYDSRVYTLFAGALDDFEVDTTAGKWNASFSAIDNLGRMKNVPVSTAVHPAVRTGVAIGFVLDAIGWTGGRDLDAGATTLRWWCAESSDAYQVLTDIVAAEGPTAFIHIGSAGEFVFRDRHHRQIRAASTAVQATFKNSPVVSPDVEHEPPFKINFGWRDLINSVEVDIADQQPSAALEEVWTDTGTYSMAAGQARQFTITTAEPFWDIATPTQGTSPDGDPDFIRLGGTLTFAFSRTSGRAATVTITASAALIISQMRLRAYKISTVGNSQKITRTDPASISKSGVKPYKPTVSINPEDGSAIADLILGANAERRSVVSFNLTNGVADQVVQQLSRDLSDRIRIVDTESGVDAGFFIERIQHTISNEGNTHTTTFSCEKAPTIASSLFRFDVAGLGFNDGVFGPSGQDDPSTMFIFDTAGHGFNDGLFAT